MDNEIWKPVIWFDGLYEVSNLWRIKSLNYKMTWLTKILKYWKLRWWHSVVSLYYQWIMTKNIVSRLVAIHFIKNPLNFPWVLHKDETIDENGLLYNWVDNLWWWTPKDNVIDKFSKWRANNNFQNNHPSKWKYWKEHFKSKKVDQYTKSWELIKTFEWTREVERELWISQSSISQCCSWIRKYAWWFKWEYNI